MCHTTPAPSGAFPHYVVTPVHPHPKGGGA